MLDARDRHVEGGRLSRLKVLRVVSVGSRSGRYGGPFDTASRQARLALGENVVARVAFGSFSHDSPDNAQPTLRLVQLPGTRSFSFALPIRGLVRLACAVWRSSVVHISIAREPVPVLACILALLLRKPLILQPHGMLTIRHSGAHRIVDSFLRRLVERADVVIALTDKEAEDLRCWARGPLQLETLANPLPPEVSAARLERVHPAPGKNVFFIARLHPRKRVLDFGLAAARSTVPDTSFVVIGPDGGDLGRLEDLARTTPNLRYGGSVSADRITDLLRSAGVFVLCSRSEPWGNVLLSALALGVPVVVSRSAALASMISHRGAGLVVDDESPGQIASAVDRLLSDRHLYDEMSRAACVLGGELADDGVVSSKLIELYELVADPERANRTSVARSAGAQAQ